MIEVIGPDGTTVVLSNSRGGSGDNFTNTVFDDEAATAIGSGAAPFTGSFRPDQPLSAFDGKSVNGTWRLHVVDAAGADVGTLSDWGMTSRSTSLRLARGRAPGRATVAWRTLTSDDLRRRAAAIVALVLAAAVAGRGGERRRPRRGGKTRSSSAARARPASRSASGW